MITHCPLENSLERFSPQMKMFTLKRRDNARKLNILSNRENFPLIFRVSAFILRDYSSLFREEGTKNMSSCMFIPCWGYIS